VIGEFVGAPRRAGDDGKPDHIRLEIERHVRDPFVNQREFHRKFRGHECRQRRERERLIPQRFFPDASAVPVKRAFRRNQRDVQRTVPLGACCRRHHGDGASSRGSPGGQVHWRAAAIKKTAAAIEENNLPCEAPQNGGRAGREDDFEDLSERAKRLARAAEPGT
jgi:hypothetical protein